MTNHEGAHVEDGALLALLDGELEGAEREALEARVNDCSELASRLDELRFATRGVTASLEALDEPSPWTEIPDALRHAARDAVRPIESARSARGARVGRRSIATAAGLTLLLAAGAYAIPGSPVRGLVDGAVSAVASLMGIGDDAPVDPGPAGVAVDLADGGVRVLITGASESLRLEVVTIGGDRAVVTTRDPRFRVEMGLVEITEPTGDLKVALPLGADRGVVEVDGVAVATFEAGRLVRAAAADDSPAEIIVRTGG
ncbi:MAG: hypothetical protein MJB57_01550 [Gemmatimonadetes bacterium]|nr:hypothetical protein [Gemmatimonadota bacterium]